MLMIKSESEQRKGMSNNKIAVELVKASLMCWTDVAWTVFWHGHIVFCLQVTQLTGNVKNSLSKANRSVLKFSVTRYELADSAVKIKNFKKSRLF